MQRRWSTRQGEVRRSRPVRSATIERGSEEQVYDLPGQKPRFLRHPKGIDTVVNNGKVVFRQGRYTDARPGMIVCSVR
jgi:hypothetical protein